MDGDIFVFVSSYAPADGGRIILDTGLKNSAF
jgi:hypothetical protein